MANSPARFQVRFEVDGDGNVKAAMDSVSVKARQAGEAADDAGKRWTSFGESIGHAVRTGTLALGGLAAGALALVIKNSVEAENSMAQLNAVLRSSGQDANFSAEQIKGMADTISKASTFSGTEVTNAATRLLSYSGIVKENFAPALQLAIDQAARLGGSVEQSAEIIGRALESPTKAAAALVQQGFGAAFTPAVRENIKALEDAGRAAEAQKIVIDILNDSYENAAAAARDTLGGAFIALKNTAGDLLEGDSGGEGLKGVRKAVEDLNNTLSDPAVQDGFRQLIELMLQAASAAASLVGQLGHVISVSRQADMLRDGKIAPKESSNEALRTRLEQVTTLRDGAKDMRTTVPLTGVPIDSLVKQRQQLLTQYDNEIITLQAELKRRTTVHINQGNVGDPQPAMRPLLPTLPGIPKTGTTTNTDTSTRKAALSEEDRAAQQLDRTYQRLMDRYAEEIALGRNASEEAKVRYMIEHEGLQGLDAARQKALITQAQYTDQMEVEEALQRSLQELDDQRSWVLDDLQAERAALGLSNDELEIRANLLRAGVSRESDWGKTITENTRQLQQERRATHDQIDAMDSVRDAGKDLFMGAATSADSFGDVAINALERLRNRMLEMAAERLMDQIFGVYGTTQTGSAGGWMASLGGWVGSLFGGNTATATAQATGNYGAFNPNMPGFGGGKATGGAIRAGSIYEVTEGGAPELLRQNGRTYLLPGARHGDPGPVCGGCRLGRTGWGRPAQHLRYADAAGGHPVHHQYLQRKSGPPQQVAGGISHVPGHQPRQREEVIYGLHRCAHQRALPVRFHRRPAVEHDAQGPGQWPCAQEQVMEIPAWQVDRQLRAADP